MIDAINNIIIVFLNTQLCQLFYSMNMQCFWIPRNMVPIFSIFSMVTITIRSIFVWFYSFVSVFYLLQIKNTGCYARQIWSRYNRRHFDDRVSLRRFCIHDIVNTTAEGIMAERVVKPVYHDFCRSCHRSENDTTISYLLGHGSALMMGSWKHFGKPFFDDLFDLSSADVKILLLTWNSSKWFMK